MEGGSNPVSPRKDDAMKHELEGLLRSDRPTHAEEGNDPEPPADDDLRVDASGPVPPPGEERDRARAETEVDALRRELARHLDRTAFPADRRTVLDVLAAHHAPDPVLEAARNLPDSGSYANVTEIVGGHDLGPALQNDEGPPVVTGFEQLPHMLPRDRPGPFATLCGPRGLLDTGKGVALSRSALGRSALGRSAL